MSDQDNRFLYAVVETAYNAEGFLLIGKPNKETAEFFSEESALAWIAEQNSHGYVQWYTIIKLVK